MQEDLLHLIETGFIQVPYLVATASYEGQIDTSMRMTGQSGRRINTSNFLLKKCINHLIS